MSSSLHAISHELKDIQAALAKLQGRKDGAEHLLPLQEKLREIDSKRVEGKFLNHDGSIPPGQAEVVDELEKCYQLANGIRTGIRTMEAELTEIKAELNKLEHARVKADDETLVSLQERLRAVEARRVDGKFVDENGGIPPGQAALTELLEECHGIKQRIIDGTQS